jgi:two-component system response regulator AtoC
MKHESQLNIVLDTLGYGYAYLDKALQIVFNNYVFQILSISHQSVHNKTIYDVYPETFGLDSILEELMQNKRSSFFIPNLERRVTDTEIFYFDLMLLSLKDKSMPIICLIKNVSEIVINKQILVQQKNEIKLLENLLGHRTQFHTASILGNSPKIGQVKLMIDKLAKVPTATVLLLGESGTGKNLVANKIHYSSNKPDTPFIEINCAALPETLLESELFGYEKGAFTHAINTRKGLIEEADGGTLFLDEIGELPVKTQAKLLSFLESKKFRRLGSNVEKKVNIRLIAATNRNLEAMVNEGTFREDLLFRLNVVTIHLPSLRELDMDISMIGLHFIKVFNLEFKKEVRGFTKNALNKLLAYKWPGNVRELSNCIERAMIFIESNYIDEDDLILGQQVKSSKQELWEIPTSGLNLEQIEKRLIESALLRANGNKSKAAKLLGLTRDTLRYRIEKYNS